MEHIKFLPLTRFQAHLLAVSESGPGFVAGCEVLQCPSPFPPVPSAPPSTHTHTHTHTHTQQQHVMLVTAHTYMYIHITWVFLLLHIMTTEEHIHVHIYYCNNSCVLHSSTQDPYMAARTCTCTYTTWEASAK